MAKAAKKGGKYKMPDPLPKGTILIDIIKKKWKLGPSIGKGGFGEIYSAQKAEESGSNFPYAVKIEPHSNGPLFVEVHFYRRNIKPESVDEFKKKNKLKTLGVPLIWGSGSHEYNNETYRFLVMDKFGDDVVKIMKNCGGKFSSEVAFKLAWQMTYVLEYIHSLGYIHADLKAANILMGASESTKGQAYLVDYGLAVKYTTEKEYKLNPKCAHNGTIEYLSRDAHCGVPTRRGDLEILAHNLIQWLGFEVPWIGQIKSPTEVQKRKEELWKDPSKFCKKNKVSDGLEKLMTYVSKLKFYDELNYNKIRDIFAAAVKNEGGSVTSPLKFDAKAKAKSPVKRKSTGSSPAAPKPKKKTKAAIIPEENPEEENNSDSEQEQQQNGGVVMNAEMKKYMAKIADKKNKPPKKKVVKKVEDIVSPGRTKKTANKPENTENLPEENGSSSRPKRRGARVVSYTED